MNNGFEPVEPPEEAPLQSEADALGLPLGLRVRPADSQYRCGQCLEMQAAGSKIVLVPDGISVGDPEWAATEAARLLSYNGRWTGWCVRCARKLRSEPASIPLGHELQAMERYIDPASDADVFAVLLLVAFIAAILFLSSQ